jgi:hypothetical protein
MARKLVLGVVAVAIGLSFMAQLGVDEWRRRKS